MKTVLRCVASSHQTTWSEQLEWVEHVHNTSTSAGRGGPPRLLSFAPRNRTSWPAPAYRVGQNVWLSTKNTSLRTESKKLSPEFIGPFKVQAIINPVTICLNLPRQLKVHNVFHVSQVKPVRTSPLIVYSLDCACFTVNKTTVVCPEEHCVWVRFLPTSP